MPVSHKRVLYATLGFLCLSLLGPGLWELFSSSPDNAGLIALQLEALNQLRAYNGMVAAVGFLAGVAIFNIEHNRSLILALAVIMLFLVLSRLISLFIDGVPGTITLTYIAIESLIAVILLVCMPPKLR
ncbi:DUF4345 domain-containing protein [Amphritea sp. HPY]|uniref:DUF4345 domain-containing protein n=1 Tax=Amphritea sp. HPY TaxID=3421652 RepID=UPI003D7E084A